MAVNRREFITGSTALAAAAVFADKAQDAGKKVYQAFESGDTGVDLSQPWQPYSERKVKVGIAGEGVCAFGSQFGYQFCPNVEIVACAEKQPARLQLLHEHLTTPMNGGRFKDYSSCEEMILDAKTTGLEAIYLATDAPSHAQLAIMALEHGLHVTTAVPAIFGREQLELVPKILAAAKRSGRIYMMNETSAFRADCFAMRRLYQDRLLGELTYTEGEYFHPAGNNLDATGSPSYGGWRLGMPPMWYSTHASAYYSLVAKKRFTSVSCRGRASLKHCYTKGNAFNNPFGSEYAFFEGEDGSSARMLVAWDTPGYGAETGRNWGQEGCYVAEKGGYDGWHRERYERDIKRYRKPNLWYIEAGSSYGGHGGSHYYLTEDFIHAIIDPKHQVVCDAVTSLNMCVAGIYAHESALKGGESLKIPAV